MQLEVEYDVIQGKDGYLFLHTGTNDNFAYVTFEKRYPQAALEKLYGQWLEARAYAAKRGSDYEVMIFPNKETLCWDKHPMSAVLDAPQSAGETVKAIDHAGIVHFARDGDARFFRKYDSHFSATGNAFHALNIARLVDPDLFEGMTEKELLTRVNYETAIATGDLGKRFEEPLLEERWIVRPANGTKVLSNNVSNRGYVELSRTRGAPAKKRVLLFGDSYARAMTQFLAPWFSELVMVHTTFFCPDLVDLYQPDFVLQSYVERFMAMPPAELLSPKPFDEIAHMSRKTPSRDMRALIASLGSKAV